MDNRNRTIYKGTLHYTTKKHPNYWKYNDQQKYQMISRYGDSVFDIKVTYLNVSCIDDGYINHQYILIDNSATNNPFSQAKFEPFNNKKVIIDGYTKGKYLYVINISLDRSTDTYLTNG